MNQSLVQTVLSLTAYSPPGPLNHLFFLLCLLLHALTLAANLLLIVTVHVDASLHKPMYTFLLHLAVNGLIGSCAVCPKVMENLLSATPVISYAGCLLQVLCVNVYATCAYAILAVMAYDRYVSICKPLQYHSIITQRKVNVLVGVAYAVPVSLLSFQVYLTAQLPLCRFTITKLFCDNLAVVKMSCVRSAFVNLYGLFITVTLVLLPFLWVLLSYGKILSVSLQASERSRRKALSTCAPHLIIFINFSVSIVFSVLYNRESTVSVNINYLNSAVFVFLPPLFHPLVYGIRTREIRRSITKIIQMNLS